MQSLAANTTGNYNVAVGKKSMYLNTTGSSNVAMGVQSLYSNTTSNYNTAIGQYALFSNTTVGENTAVGYGALYSNTTGPRNTCVGTSAGYSVTTGNDNVFVGYNAGQYSSPTTTGGGNVILGAYARASAAGDQLCIVMGRDATGKGSSTGFINPNGGGVYQGNNSSSWSTTSDRRLKKNIVDNNIGLEKLVQIQVRNFEYRLPEEVDPELSPTDAIKKQGVQLGVIAQELQQVFPDCVKQESTGVLSVDPDNLTWYTINAIKQLKAELDAAKAEIATLKGN
jgi:hypothetical protein